MTRKEALAKGYKRYFSGTACVKGHVSERRAKTGECLACRAKYLSLWQKRNPEKIKQYNFTNYSKDPKKVVEHVKRWAKKNPAKILARTRAHRIKTKMRFPKWLTADDLWMMEQTYELAALRTKVLGFPWQVDHILPLHGKLVSGLHVPYNLQVIPQADNVRKSNKFNVA